MFVFNEGLVRVASEPYSQSNLQDTFVHLTNYSLNKTNENFKPEHKLLLSQVLTGTLTQPQQKPGKPGSSRRAEEIWSEVK